jgi:hypothetical protein
VALACQREAPPEHAVALAALVQALKQENKAAGEVDPLPPQLEFEPSRPFLRHVVLVVALLLSPFAAHACALTLSSLLLCLLLTCCQCARYAVLCCVPSRSHTVLPHRCS